MVVLNLEAPIPPKYCQLEVKSLGGFVEFDVHKASANWIPQLNDMLAKLTNNYPGLPHVGWLHVASTHQMQQAD